MKLDLNCEHYKVPNKEGKIEACKCEKKNKRWLKYLQFSFPIENSYTNKQNQHDNKIHQALEKLKQGNH